VKIAFEVPPLRGREMIESIIRQRIGQQARVLDRLIAGFAQTERAIVHPIECGINLLQQLNQSRAFSVGRDCRFEFLAPVEQLGTEHLVSEVAGDRSRVHAFD
jgi:hypothetical protein